MDYIAQNNRNSQKDTKWIFSYYKFKNFFIIIICYLEKILNYQLCFKSDNCFSKIIYYFKYLF